jgi:dienelactone hydrolase
MRSRRAIACFCLFAIGACNGSPTATDAGDVAGSDAIDAMDVAPRTPALVARFQLTSGQTPAPFEVPFPSDLYLDANGRVIATLDDYTAVHLTRATDVFAAAFSGLDGFGLTTGAMFRIDGTTALDSDPPITVDPATLPNTAEQSLAATASAFIVDLDPSLDAAHARIPCTAGYQVAFDTIAVVPERAVLAPGRRYAVVLTDRIRATSGNLALAASPQFAAIRDASNGARDDAAGMLYGNAVDRVVQIMGSGFDRSRIVATAVFTTQTTPRQLRVARDAIVAGGASTSPNLSTSATESMPFHVARFGASEHPGWTATLDAWLGTPLRNNGTDVPGFPVSGETDRGIAHDQIGAVVTGTFIAPDYRDATNHLQLDASGAPLAQRPNLRIPVTLALPRGSMPASGFPVVMFGHGLGGQRREMLAIANELARVGIATAAIDHATFGQRSSATDETSIEGGSYRGPDGLGDSPNYPVADFFGGLTNITAFRDNIRQTALDLVQLRRLLANPALDLSFVADEYGGTAPRIDGSHVGYVGNSLGGIIGTVFAATEPEANPFVLNVAGGAFLTRLVADAPSQADLVNQVTRIIFGAPNDAVLDRFHPISNLIQMIVDGADPAAYAATITRPSTGRPHDVWLVEALWDDTVANSSTDLLAYVMQLPQIGPAANPLTGLDPVDGPTVSGNLAMGATGGFFQLSPAVHGADLDNRYGSRNFVPPFPTNDPGNRFRRVTMPFRVRQPIVAYQQRIATFFTTAFASVGHAIIDVHGLEPLLDYDDDGWTDDEERAMSTNPADPVSRPAGTPPHLRDVGF